MKTFKRARPGIVGIFVGSLILGITGCDSSSGLGTSKFRAVNASPDSGAIDVYLDGGVEFDGLRYPDGTTYEKLDSGPHDFKITLNDSFTTFFDSRKTLNDDAEYTLFMFDFTIDGTGTLVLDDNTRPDSGLVKLRFVHAAPSLEDIDLYITDLNEPIEDIPPTFENVRFKEIPDYVESIDGVYQIRATLRGSKAVIADSGAVRLEERRIMTVLLIERAGGGAPFQFQVLVDS